MRSRRSAPSHRVKTSPMSAARWLPVPWAPGEVLDVALAVLGAGATAKVVDSSAGHAGVGRDVAEVTDVLGVVVRGGDPLELVTCDRPP